MQKITVIGRLGRDAVIREMEQGGKVISFTVAVNGRYRGVDKTYWYDVSAFNYDRYKNMVKYFTKGSSVIVVGDLDCDIDEGKDGAVRCRRSITADSIEFNSSSTSGGTANSQSTRVSSAKSEKASKSSDEGVPDDMPADDEIVVSTKTRAKKKAEPVKEAVVEDTDEGENDDEGELPF